MNPNRIDEESIFATAIEKTSPEEREKFLKQQCACGYSMRGLPHTVERCPECGVKRKLRSKSLWLRGDRVIILGVLLIILSLLLSPLSFAGFAVISS